MSLLRANQASSWKRIQLAADRFADDLQALAIEEQHWDEVRELGGIDLLVSILRLGPCRAATQSAAALTHLAHSSANRDAIREAGGVSLLVNLLTEPSDGTPVVVAARMAGTPVAYDWIETATNAAAALRNLTHNNASNQDAIREAGGVAPLIRLLGQGAASNAASRAADALGGLARNTHRANQIAIREHGGIEQLVALLTQEPIGEAATKAAGALKHLAFAYSANREAIRDAGGIDPLVALLELRREVEEDVMIIAGALWNLGYNNQPNQDAIREAGGLRLLVQLLKTGASWKAMPNVVGAIRNLCQNCTSNKEAVRESGGIAGLVELLQAGHESPAAIKAAETLEVVLDVNAANERATIGAILAHGEAKELLSGFPSLLERLQKAAERVLMTAVERNDTSAYERALSEARKLDVQQKIIDDAEQRSNAVREQARLEAARRARRESLGLGALSTPNEFLCPITQDVMIDPVVASDGHSYERQAIQAILDRGSPDGGAALSPLTREELEPVLVPNINLRKRIREHDSEVESVAEQVLSSIGHPAATRAPRAPSEGAGVGSGGSGGGGGAAVVPRVLVGSSGAGAEADDVDAADPALDDAPPSAGGVHTTQQHAHADSRTRGGAAAAAAAGATTPASGSFVGGGGGATAAAAQSAQTSLLPDSSYVAAQLTALGLQRYAQAFDEHGYDCWAELLLMGGDQLDKLAATVGMASNHSDRLRAALSKQRKTGGGGGGGGGGGAAVDPRLAEPPSAASGRAARSSNRAGTASSRALLRAEAEGADQGESTDSGGEDQVLRGGRSRSRQVMRAEQPVARGRKREASTGSPERGDGGSRKVRRTAAGSSR